jgi:hypothetical protein
MIKLSEFKEKVESIGLTDQKIIFDANSAEFKCYPFQNDIYGQLFIWSTCILLVRKSSSTIFVAILIFAFSLYLYYMNFIGAGSFKVDFTRRSITYNNRFPFFNIIRKWWGFKKKFDFSKVKNISSKEGTLLDRSRSTLYDTRYFLTIETETDPPIIVCQFKDEKQAIALANILRKAITT